MHYLMAKVRKSALKALLRFKKISSYNGYADAPYSEEKLFYIALTLIIIIK